MIEFKSSLKIKNEKTNLVVGVFSDISHDIITQLDKASFNIEKSIIRPAVSPKSKHFKKTEYIIFRRQYIG